MPVLLKIGGTSSGRFFFNNGITLVCKSVTFTPVDESPTIEIRGMQIVNGGQTSNALLEAHQTNVLPDSLYVLIKIIATEKQDLIEKITESTNSQTNVRARDLRSNDTVQKSVEKILFNSGYFYERRKNQFATNSAARGKKIDMEIAAQACYAFVHKKPADAKNKKGQLFGALYEEIFDRNDKKLAEDILLAFKAREWIRKSHVDTIDRFSFVRHAEFHSLAMLALCGISSIEDLERDSTQKLYERILEANAIVVAEESEKLKDRYSHRQLFIDPTTIGRIQEAMRK